MSVSRRRRPFTLLSRRIGSESWWSSGSSSFTHLRLVHALLCLRPRPAKKPWKARPRPGRSSSHVECGVVRTGFYPSSPALDADANLVGVHLGDGPTDQPTNPLSSKIPKTNSRTTRSSTERRLGMLHSFVLAEFPVRIDFSVTPTL